MVWGGEELEAPWWSDSGGGVTLPSCVLQSSPCILTWEIVPKLSRFSFIGTLTHSWSLQSYEPALSQWRTLSCHHRVGQGLNVHILKTFSSWSQWSFHYSRLLPLSYFYWGKIIFSHFYSRICRNCFKFIVYWLFHFSDISGSLSFDQFFSWFSCFLLTGGHTHYRCCIVEQVQYFINFYLKLMVFYLDWC